MLQFVCDYCGVVKEPRQVWINGVAVENVGTRAARREVVIEPVWRRERAVLPLAVHFCCTNCKDQYLAELFQQPMPRLETERVTTTTGTAVVVRARRKPVAITSGRKTATARKR